MLERTIDKMETLLDVIKSLNFAYWRGRVAAARNFEEIKKIGVEFLAQISNPETFTIDFLKENGLKGVALTFVKRLTSGDSWEYSDHPEAMEALTIIIDRAERDFEAWRFANYIAGFILMLGFELPRPLADWQMEFNLCGANNPDETIPSRSQGNEGIPPSAYELRGENYQFADELLQEIGIGTPGHRHEIIAEYAEDDLDPGSIEKALQRYKDRIREDRDTIYQILSVFM